MARLVVSVSRVHKGNRLTVPRIIAELLGLGKGDYVVWIYDDERGEVWLKKLERGDLDNPLIAQRVEYITKISEKKQQQYLQRRQGGGAGNG